MSCSFTTGAGSSKGAEQQEQQQAPRPRKPLLLGTGLIEQDPDFAEIVSLTLIQVCVCVCVCVCEHKAGCGMHIPHNTHRKH